MDPLSSALAPAFEPGASMAQLEETARRAMPLVRGQRVSPATQEALTLATRRAADEGVFPRAGAQLTLEFEPHPDVALVAALLDAYASAWAKCGDAMTTDETGVCCELLATTSSAGDDARGLRWDGALAILDAAVDGIELSGSAYVWRLTPHKLMSAFCAASKLVPLADLRQRLVGLLAQDLDFDTSFFTLALLGASLTASDAFSEDECRALVPRMAALIAGASEFDLGDGPTVTYATVAAARLLNCAPASALPRKHEVAVVRAAVPLAVFVTADVLAVVFDGHPDRVSMLSAGELARVMDKVRREPGECARVVHALTLAVRIGQLDVDAVSWWASCMRGAVKAGPGLEAVLEHVDALEALRPGFVLGNAEDKAEMLRNLERAYAGGADVARAWRQTRFKFEDWDPVRAGMLALCAERRLAREDGDHAVRSRICTFLWEKQEWEGRVAGVVDLHGSSWSDPALSPCGRWAALCNSNAKGADGQQLEPVVVDVRDALAPRMSERKLGTAVDWTLPERSLRWSSTSRFVVSAAWERDGQGEWAVWDWGTGLAQAGRALTVGLPSGQSKTPDAERLATFSADDSRFGLVVGASVRVWELRETAQGAEFQLAEQQPPVFQGAKLFCAVALSRTGTKLAVSGVGPNEWFIAELVQSERDGVWSPVSRFAMHIHILAYAAQGTRIWAICGDRLMSLESGALGRERAVHGPQSVAKFCAESEKGVMGFISNDKGVGVVNADDGVARVLDEGEMPSKFALALVKVGAGAQRNEVWRGVSVEETGKGRVRVAVWV